MLKSKCPLLCYAGETLSLIKSDGTEFLSETVSSSGGECNMCSIIIGKNKDYFVY